MDDTINFYFMDDITLLIILIGGGGNKNPITMQNETHGGNESDAMVFRAWWCIVLLFRGLNLKWLCKMRILFFIFNKFEKVSFSFESEIYLLLKYANYNWIIESWLSEINWETRIFRQKILLILRNQFCLKWIILYLKKKKKNNFYFKIRNHKS